ncbi:MAG: type II secretion system protein N [Polaromonas sp.]|uniref:type II secretion system protein N n=1 Tax=Polaromonas sp. TaxID=1869339 RepID=UPI002732714B|nr:type II secretion system protein N [Polaromonas sp.]MDP3798515.1 type II secretion system protein N [Polaromonas sp.]
MVTLSQSRLGLRTITLVVWALAAASLMYWGLRLASGRGVAEPAPVTSASPAAIDPLAVARVLGAATPTTTPQVSSASRFVLHGVVAGSPGGGAALIAIDGKPARPFRVGSEVEEGLILQSTAARQATLGATRNGPAIVTLDMPPLTR